VVSRQALAGLPQPPRRKKRASVIEERAPASLSKPPARDHRASQRSTRRHDNEGSCSYSPRMSASRFGASPSLHLLLEGEGVCDGLGLPTPDELHRPSVTRVRRPMWPMLVPPHARLEVPRATDVVGAVRALKDVDVAHPGRVQWSATVEPETTAAVDQGPPRGACRHEMVVSRRSPRSLLAHRADQVAAWTSVSWR